MRLATLISLVRPIGPVVVGISLGFTLSLLSVTWVDESCGFGAVGATQETPVAPPGGARKPNSIANGNAEEDDFQPRIVPYHKPTQQVSQKKVIRAKYASTELGIRERLFVAVLTSKNNLNTLAVAINRTLNHHLDGCLMFFTSSRSRKVPHGMFVFAHGDEHPVPNMFQTIKYLLEHHVAEYDWFYLLQDDTYTQPDRLKTLVSHLSMDLHLYMGRPGEFIGGKAQGGYCQGSSGFLLSRALLMKLQPFLERCRVDIVSTRPDEWLGRCIIDYIGTSCVEEHEEEIKNISRIAADGKRSALWPVGVQPPFEPKNRFEVLRWDYFTEEQLFSCTDGAPKCPLSGADRADVADVIQVAVAELSKRYSPALELTVPRLVNGYRRFDPTRGMEYTLDLQLRAETKSGSREMVTRRVHLVRPLSRVEIIPMPYVTEAMRVHILLPLTCADRSAALEFLERSASNLFEPTENAVLSLLFLYEPGEAQKLGTDDIFADVKAKVSALERRFPNLKVPWISMKTENPGLLRVLDVVSRKHPADTLFLLVTADTMLNSEFLNRCRMNAISGWQVFFPVHFQNYDPQVAYPNQTAPTVPELSREAGHFDRHAFQEACFYNGDYVFARGRMDSEIREDEDLLESLDVYDVFVRYSGLHVFRAVEPALCQEYRNRKCDPRLSEDVFHRCLQSKHESVGSRSQLAMLMFEQEQGNST
ncbi:chondroitin sulfate synthase 2 isoform X2 [Trichomycterus rosablanca]|uniref:chondroitin sulfate synthase 2 isoform X2 n=1 Tax=Trichomycterus rosablanca TaxID=2290929 RepID=UPI002F35CC4D